MLLEGMGCDDGHDGDDDDSDDDEDNHDDDEDDDDDGEDDDDDGGCRPSTEKFNVSKPSSAY